MDNVFTAPSVFLACLVEMVEALTIILAIGAARQWRSTMQGAIAALILLGILVAIFGRALQNIPQETLWFVVGTLLMFFGVQWLRNAILRYAGIKPLHDEAATFRRVSKDATQKKHTASFDGYAFTVTFKGVFIEGLEVVFIVLSFGSSQGNLRSAIIAAGLAFIVVAVLGIVVHRPLTRVPENTMKFIVGLVLTTFGTYFGTMGLGIVWPGGRLTITYIFVFYLLTSLIALRFLKQDVSKSNA